MYITAEIYGSKATVTLHLENGKTISRTMERQDAGYWKGTKKGNFYDDLLKLQKSDEWDGFEKEFEDLADALDDLQSVDAMQALEHLGYM